MSRSFIFLLMLLLALTALQAGVFAETTDCDNSISPLPMNQNRDSLIAYGHVQMMQISGSIPSKITFAERGSKGDITGACFMGLVPFYSGSWLIQWDWVGLGLVGGKTLGVSLILGGYIKGAIQRSGNDANLYVPIWLSGIGIYSAFAVADMIYSAILVSRGGILASIRKNKVFKQVSNDNYSYFVIPRINQDMNEVLSMKVKSTMFHYDGVNVGFMATF